MNTMERLLIIFTCILLPTFSGCHKKPNVSEEYLKNTHCIIAVIEPTDMELYKSLMPDHPDFSMPDKALVGIYVAYFYVPGIPFVESGITIRCKFKGREGWTLVFNTVEKSERLIYHAARMTGFPKYKVDSIPLLPSDGRWKGEIINEGKTWLALDFSPEEITGEFPEWQSKFLKGEKYRLDEPLFLLIPPREGPRTTEYDTSTLSGGGSREYQTGMVKITTESDEPWAELVPSEPVPGLFFMDQ